MDGGVLPPYFDPPMTDANGNSVDANGQPIPTPTGCSGLGAVGDTLVLLRSDVVAPMPSITTTARTGCTRPITDLCPSGIASFVQSNPWLALAFAIAAGALLFGGKK